MNDRIALDQKLSDLLPGELVKLLHLLRDDKQPDRIPLAGSDNEPLALDDYIYVDIVVTNEKCSEARSWLENRDAKLGAGQYGIFTARIKVGLLLEATDIPGIERIELPSTLFRQDKARLVSRFTKVSAKQSGTQLTGAGVCVGIVDSGVDWRHGDFRTADGDTRLDKFMWYLGSLDVAEYTRSEINQALMGKFHIPYRDKRGHGTHCLSIAAGNGQATKSKKYHGIAPEATLLGFGTEEYSTPAVNIGLNRLVEAAGNKPLVVNLSYGGHKGAHDGTSAIEKSIDRLSGEGRIFVISAGNEREDGLHWGSCLIEGEDTIIPVRIASTQRQWVELWVPIEDSFDIFLVAPDGREYEEALRAQETVFGKFDFTKTNNKSVNAAWQVSFWFEHAKTNFVWKIRIVPTEVKNGGIHAWSGCDDRSANAHLFLTPPTTDHTVGIPATAKQGICVGSFISSPTLPDIPAEDDGIRSIFNVGDLSPFSSEGPTRANIRKPDITAPGQYITAALASDSYICDSDDYKPRHIEGFPYVALQGTSMSAPFVTGMIALMLEACPNLTPDEVREILKSSANRRGIEVDSEGWNPGFGYGKIDPVELFKLLDCG